MNRYHPYRLMVLLSLAAVVLSACGVSLASDITPPADYRPPTPAVPVSQQNVFPLVPPDPLAGAAIFAEKCAPCHGTTGNGDGTQAANLPVPPAILASADLAHKARPVDWFNLVTSGNIQRMMPPFQSLDERQRWDVVAYAFTLSTNPQQLAQGKTIYDAKCANCHGATGKGDGPDGASLKPAPANWADPSVLAQLSGQDLVNVTTKGAGTGMPAFTTFTQDEIWAVATYIRSLSFNQGASQQAAAVSTAIATSAPTNAAATAEPPTGTGTQVNPPTPASPPSTDTGAQSTPVTNNTPATADTAVATAVPPVSNTPGAGTPVVTGKVDVTGKLANGSGGTIPSGLKVNLQGFDTSMTPSSTATADVQADGSYTFKDVEVVTNRVYMASVQYNNMTFDSAAVHASDIKANTPVDMSITIYDTTTDASQLTAQRMHVFLDNSTPGVLQVAELFIINNPSNKAVVAAKPAEAILQFELPAGATNLSFQDGVLGGRYLQTDKGFGDTAPVQPGAVDQILFAYDLPYKEGMSVSIPVTLPVEAAVLLVPSGSMTVESSQLSSMGSQPTQGGGTVTVSVASNLPAKSSLDFKVTGQAAAGGAATATNNNSGLIIGLGAFGIVLVAVGFFFLRQRRASAPAAPVDEVPGEPDSMDVILDEIVALDDLYQSGDLPQEAYDQRRAELKARLKALKD